MLSVGENQGLRQDAEKAVQTVVETCDSTAVVNVLTSYLQAAVSESQSPVIIATIKQVCILFLLFYKRVIVSDFDFLTVKTCNNSPKLFSCL